MNKLEFHSEEVVQEILSGKDPEGEVLEYSMDQKFDFFSYYIPILLKIYTFKEETQRDIVLLKIGKLLPKILSEFPGNSEISLQEYLKNGLLKEVLKKYIIEDKIIYKNGNDISAKK